MSFRTLLCRAALSGIGALLVTAAQAAPVFEMQLLPLPAGISQGGAWDINNAGQIIGSATGGAALYWSGSGSVQTFGNSRTFVSSINAAGLVTGGSTGPARAFRWDPATGVMTNLSTPNGSSAGEVAFDSGVVFGTIRGTAGNFQPVIWRTNGSRAAMPGWTTDMHVMRTAANADGIAIVQYRKDNGEQGTLKWNTVTDSVTPVSLSGTERLAAYSSNGTLVGAIENASSFSIDSGFIWTEIGGFQTIDAPASALGYLTDAAAFDPTDINASGWVTGNCYCDNRSQGGGLLFDGSDSYFLDDLVLNLASIPNLKIDSANAINDLGWIVASGYIDDPLDNNSFGRYVPLLLKPVTAQVPEPGSLALLLGGLALIRVRQRRAIAA